ncbi:hypothetical protein AVEN_63134-1 [Araneus ventricosus]|uniref:Uncharacterized protein n=1 Tax=Araneus ventricosus TaxID=182803 RepID=A0A4Y2NRW3_ARAVE|nr:hypothetical protein AVEN_63134-1 [Araneus ventricosus]
MYNRSTSLYNTITVVTLSRNLDPANHISRGISPAELSSLDTWWNSPDWLSQHPDKWPAESDSKGKNPNKLQLKLGSQNCNPCVPQVTDC